MSVLRRKTKSRRREELRPTQFAAIGLIVAGLVTFGVAVALRTPSGLPVLDYQRLQALVPDAGTLRTHNEVRIAGVRQGEVTDVQPRGGQALIEFRLDPGVKVLPADSTVRVRGRGLLGTRFLEIAPGQSSRQLRDGDVIRGGPDSISYGVPDALDTFDAETRGALAEMLAGLGEGMLDRGLQLNQAIHAVRPGVPAFRSIAKEIAARPGSARRLVPNLQGAAAAFENIEGEIPAGMRATADAIEPFKDRRAALRATLAKAPPALAALDPALDEGHELLAGARTLAVAARRALARAPAGLREARALLRSTRTPLQRTRTLLRAVRPAVPSTLTVTSALNPLLDPLRRLGADLSPPVAILGQHGCDLQNFADNWRSTLGQGIAGGGKIGPLTTFRIEAVVGPESIGGGQYGRLPTSKGVDRDTYSAPCKYGPNTYDATGLDADRLPGLRP